ATAWILRTAGAMIAAENPDLAIVRIPYLGQVARRFGPDGREAGRAVRELEPVLGPFLRQIPRNVVTLIASESVSTPVIGAMYPNRVLRELGLLPLAQRPGGGLEFDVNRSTAFAVTDPQLCHIYLNDASQSATVAASFSGPRADGVATVACGAHRAA